MIYSCILLALWFGILIGAQRKIHYIALLGFPGVVLHETMHFLVGLILFAKPASFSLIPRRSQQGKGWELGSVTFTGLTIFNAAPVALAPLLLIAVAWFLFMHWMLPLFQMQLYWQWVLSGYVIACALVYSVPSSTDLKIGATSFLLWAVVAAGCWWLAMYYLQNR